LNATASIFDKVLLARAVNSFADLLEGCRLHDKQWNRLVEGIHRHGLLNFTVSVDRPDRVPTVEQERLHDRTYRRKLAKQLSKPVGPDFRQGVIPLHRDELADPTYLHKMAGILGYRWLQKLNLRPGDVYTQRILLHLNADILSECLHRMFRHQSTAKNVADHIMLTFAYEEIDKDPQVQEIFAKLNRACDEVEARYIERMDEVISAIKQDIDRRSNR